jgi:hypothetical protein
MYSVDARSICIVLLVCTCCLSQEILVSQPDKHEDRDMARGWSIHASDHARCAAAIRPASLDMACGFGAMSFGPRD